MQQTGATLKDSLDNTLKQLIQKELIIARYYRLINSGDLVLTDVEKMRDFNKTWKAVYDYCDQQISSIETGIYQSKGLNPPAKGQAGGEPQYPLNTLISKSLKDKDEELDKVTEPKRFAPSKIADSDDNRHDAVKRFIIRMIQEVSDIKLDKDEEKALQDDKDFISDIANKNKIYNKIMGEDGFIEKDDVTDKSGFFCIRKLIALNQADQTKYERMQSYYNDQVSLSDTDVQKYYDDTLKAQKLRFGGTKENPTVNVQAYFDALKDTSGTPFVFYHPISDPKAAPFYVKHILVPFTEANQAIITAHGIGRTELQKFVFQRGEAANITAYQRTNNADDLSKPRLTMKQIRDSIPGNTDEWTFNNLINLYNTDPGAFNNETGYLMPPKNSGIDSGFMKEFADGAWELVEKYNIGDVLPGEAITSYGVHIMYYSSNTADWHKGSRQGVVDLGDFTSPMKLQTYGDAVRESLLQTMRAVNFDRQTESIINDNFHDEKYVTLFESKYADLHKNSR